MTENHRETDIPVCNSPILPTTPAIAPPQSATHIYRRNLPHWRRDGGIYWITFRMADALPQSKIAQIRSEKNAWLQNNLEPWSAEQRLDFNELFGERVQRWLDAGYGSCALAKPEIRQIVRECLTRFDGDRLRLHAAVIMPNHVHALIEPLQKEKSKTDIPVCSDTTQNRQECLFYVSALSRLLKGIKGASARGANKLLGRTGSFWMDESYDRIVRNEKEYQYFFEYIHQNPIKAGLSKDQFWLHPQRE